MEAYLLNWLEASGVFAVLVSILFNIVISILGFVPSVFITAANITFFGFEFGLLLSIIGEAGGAIISFILYRKGITKLIDKAQITQKYVVKLKNAQGIEAFLLILALRVFPFAPSGAVTIAGAFSEIGVVTFSIASTLGKIPALIIEAYSIQQVLIWSWQGKVILGLVSIVIIGLLVKRRR